MARTKKTRLKQKLAQALHHLEVAKGNLGEVWTEFDGVHEDHAASLVLLAQAVEALQDSIRKFWEWSWGSCPDDTDGYRI